MATVLRTLHTDQQHPFCQLAKEVRIQSMDQPLLNPLSTQRFSALNLAWLHRTMRAIGKLIDQRTRWSRTASSFVNRRLRRSRNTSTHRIGGFLHPRENV